MANLRALQIAGLLDFRQQNKLMALALMGH